MYFGQAWHTVDDEPIYEYFIPDTVMKGLHDGLGEYVYNKYDYYAHDIEWKHTGPIGRCTIGNVVRHNTGATLSKKNKDWIECKTCRGKGHSWKCQIWNGRPYIVTGQKHRCDTSTIDWKNPDWCKDCKGKG